MIAGYETPGSLSGSLSNRGGQQAPVNQQPPSGMPGNGSRSPALFSTRVRAGKRTYFFDVNQSSNGSLYITVCESKYTEGDSYEKNRLMVFQDSLPGFVQAMGKALDFVEKSGGTTPPQPQ